MPEAEEGTATRSPQGATAPREGSVVVRLAGVVCGIAGVGVIAGWHLGWERLVALGPGLATMAHNEAVAVALLGGSLVLLASARPRLAAIPALAAAAIALATLSQWVLGWDLRIDTAIPVGQVGRPVEIAGRMSPNAALGLLLAGIAVAIDLRTRAGRPSSELRSVLASIVLGLGGAAVTGCVGNTNVGASWYGGNPIGVHSGACLAILGIGLLARAWGEGAPHRGGLPAWLPTAAWVLGLASSGMLWLALRGQEAEVLERAVQSDAAQLDSHVRDELDERRGALRRLARRTSARPTDDDAVFEFDVTAYLADYRDIRAIALLGADGNVVRTVPASASADLEACRRAGLFDPPGDTTTHAARLPGPGAVIGLSTGVARDGRNPLRILAVLDTAILVRRILDLERMGGSIALRLFEGGGLAYEQVPDRHPLATWVSGSVQGHGAHPAWCIEVTPTTDRVAELETPLPATVLGFGLLASTLLAASLHLGTRSRLRAADLAETNLLIETEVGRRRAAWDALNRTTAMLAGVFEAAPDAILVVGVDGLIAQANAQSERTFGYGRAELIGQPLERLVEPGARERHAALRKSFFEEPTLGAMGRGRQFNAVHRDGSLIPVEVTLARLATDDTPLSLAVVRDLTAERRAQEALSHSEERYRTFFEKTPAAAFITSADGTIEDCNPAFAAMLGFASVADAKNVNVRDLCVRAQDHEMLLAEVSSARTVPHREVELRRRDGQTIHVVESLSGELDSEGNLRRMKGHLVDVTEQRHLGEQLLQAQKMEALGRLAGGVAHDFNNLLTAIVGYGQILLEDAGSETPQGQSALQILGAAERATKLTQQLLAFSRKQSVKPQVFDPRGAASRMEPLLQRMIGEDVQFELKAAEDVGRVHVDPTQFEQVVMNLAVNARDAMPDGGKLRVEVRNTSAGEVLVPGEAVSKGGWVVLTVTDSGVGMDEATRRRIFEPFFTTKKHGTGIGLATVYGVVKQSGGHITVSSEPGKGTTFKVYLPRVDLPAEVSAERGAAATTLRGNEIVLLVEDDKTVRDICSVVLREYGYVVLEAGEVEQALRHVTASSGPIQLLLTDVVMPGMSGPQLAERIRVSRPSIRVLYMSGYAEDASSSPRLREHGASFLQKPFSPETLARKVREVLDR